MTRYTFSVWFKGEKPIYRPPYPAVLICETVEYNVNNSGLDRLTVLHDMDTLPTDSLLNPFDVVTASTGGYSEMCNIELYENVPPKPKPKNSPWWKKQRSPNLRREF